LSGLAGHLSPSRVPIEWYPLHRSDATVIIEPTRPANVPRLLETPPGMTIY